MSGMVLIWSTEHTRCAQEAEVPPGPDWHMVECYCAVDMEYYCHIKKYYYLKVFRSK